MRLALLVLLALGCAHPAPQCPVQSHGSAFDGLQVDCSTWIVRDELASAAAPVRACLARHAWDLCLEYLASSNQASRQTIACAVKATPWTENGPPRHAQWWLDDHKIRVKNGASWPEQLDSETSTLVPTKRVHSN